MLQGDILTILFYRTPGETPEVDPATVAPLTVFHAERGLVDARTGFARGLHETVSTFEAKRNGIAHFQYDIGNFTLYGEGGRWAIDPGFDCVACKDDGITHLAGYADYHNVVVIDGAQRTQVSDSRYSMVRGPDHRPVRQRAQPLAGPRGHPVRLRRVRRRASTPRSPGGTTCSRACPVARCCWPSPTRSSETEAPHAYRWQMLDRQRQHRHDERQRLQDPARGGADRSARTCGQCRVLSCRSS